MDRQELIEEILNEVKPCDNECWVTERWIGDVLVSVKLPAKLTGNVVLLKIEDDGIDPFPHSEEEVDERMAYEKELKARGYTNWEEIYSMVLDRFAIKEEVVPYIGTRDYLDNIKRTIIMKKEGSRKGYYRKTV